MLAAAGAHGAATDMTISMDQAPSTPKIHAPSVVSARPGSPWVYAIPSTGQAPLGFSAQGLPAGLSLDASSGILSGTMPVAGSYPVVITASNSSGSASATLTLVSGNTLSLTPAMGWNSYDSFGGGVTEQETMDAATVLKAKLQPFGWNTVVVDYLWYDGEQLIDANGRYLPSPRRFPSATGTLGFKPLADKIHALGLQFGIHIMRGVPRKSVSAKSPIAGSTYTAADAANTSDACAWDSHMWGVRGATAAGQAWYDSIFSQYAEWGIDFVKVDDMVGGAYHQEEVIAIRKAIDKTGRSIVLSLSPGPMQTRDAVNLNANANMWRMVNDFWDTNGLSNLNDEFDTAANWQAVTGLDVGHWPDADMLPLGYIGPRCPVHGAGPTGLSHNLQVLVMTLWSILPSPLMFGGNVPALATDGTGPWTTALRGRPGRPGSSREAAPARWQHRGVDPGAQRRSAGGGAVQSGDARRDDDRALQPARGLGADGGPRSLAPTAGQQRCRGAERERPPRIRAAVHPLPTGARRRSWRNRRRRDHGRRGARQWRTWHWRRRRDWRGRRHWRGNRRGRWRGSRRRARGRRGGPPSRWRGLQTERLRDRWVRGSLRRTAWLDGLGGAGGGAAPRGPTETLTLRRRPWLGAGETRGRRTPRKTGGRSAP